jgi:hypothetical protein
MNKQPIFKKLMIMGLTLSMVLGGAGAALAHGNDKGQKQEHGNQGNNGDNQKNSKGNETKNLTVHFKFDDVKGADIDWSAKNIASLAALRIFDGYDDGTFRPRNTVTRIEAIISAVRLMGLRTQAESAAEMQTHLNFKDADKIVQKYPNAVGYVAVAAENDLFLETDNEIMPEKAATRLWATTLLVKALKLDTEAKAKMNTHLTFSDAQDIPAGSVGYVAVAVEKGLISGFENNTFRPNAPVTRAQLAALLDRTSDQMVGNAAVKGIVTAAVYSNILNLNVDNAAQQVTLDPNAFIYSGGVKVTVASLKVGDEVKVRLYNGVAIFVEVVKPADVQPAAFTVNGLFTSLTLNAQGKISTVTVSQTINGAVQTTTYSFTADATIAGDYTQLVLNHAIVLKGTGTTVNFLQIL